MHGARPPLASILYSAQLRYRTVAARSGCGRRRCILGRDIGELGWIREKVVRADCTARGVGCRAASSQALHARRTLCSVRRSVWFAYVACAPRWDIWRAQRGRGSGVQKARPPGHPIVAVFLSYEDAQCEGLGIPTLPYRCTCISASGDGNGDWYKTPPSFHKSLSSRITALCNG